MTKAKTDGTEAVWAVGLMTGTVLDGNIDIAAVRTDGETIAEFGPWALAPYSDDVRGRLVEAVERARSWQFEGPEPAIFAEAERMLTVAQADAVAAFLRRHDIATTSVRAIGFHGQTVLHRAGTPERRGATRQLGDGAAMAARLGIDTVFDFRTADVEAGGQGAPLAASYHAALLRQARLDSSTAVLNLGGVANLTWWDGADRLHAFDTGPANAPSNDWMMRLGLGPMDRDGRLAATGLVDEARLARLLADPWFAAPYPKSLDRNSFTAAMADGLSPADGAATLAAFTGGAVGRALDLLPLRPKRLVVCGGGRRNPAILRAVAERAGVAVEPAEAMGWRGDAVEAECFAFLAIRAIRGLPISYPTTTGVPHPMSGGRVATPDGTIRACVRRSRP